MQVQETRHSTSFDEYCEHLPRKFTRGQRQVLQTLFRVGKLLSAQEIHRYLYTLYKERAPGLTTVYRAVERLLNMGLVEYSILSDGEKRYELVAPGIHQHHLRCNQCKTSVALGDCFIANTRSEIERQYGFVITSHVLELSGLCQSCKNPQQAER